jgi:hypothetical protein
MTPVERCVIDKREARGKIVVLEFHVQGDLWGEYGVWS